MLKSISLKNFKAFSNLPPTDIKPITIFCGTNSCGKSSLLQSLLLWKQSLESRNYDQSLLMNGRLIHLGTFKNAIHGYDITTPMEFNFEYEFRPSDFYRIGKNSPYRYPVVYMMREFVPGLDTNIWNTKFNIRYGVELITTASSDISSFMRTVVPKSIKLEITAEKPEGDKIPGVIFNITQVSDTHEYDFFWKNVSKRQQRQEELPEGIAHIQRLELTNLVPSDIKFSSEDEDNRHRDLLILFFRLGDILRSIFASFTYLGPLREEPARRYIYENEVVEIGVKGENAAYIYLSERTEHISSHFLYNSSSDIFEIKENLTLREFVESWLDIMGIHAFDVENESEIIRLLLNSSNYDNTRVNIADVGFGVSQVFPIVLEGLRMNEGQTLLLEQPEIHLHPRLQMQLADYLLSLALSGKKVILETHSDHIVNRLVRRMVEDHDGRIASLIAMYFVRQGPNGSTIEPVSLSKDEGIVNWPDEFFDQAALEQQRIMQAIISKSL